MPPTKTSLLSCRVHLATRQALEKAATRERRTLSNFLEVALIQALPADIRAELEMHLATPAKAGEAP